MKTIAILMILLAGFAIADDDGVTDTTDQCPDSPAGCTVAGGQIDATTGCPTVPFTFNPLSDAQVYIDGTYVVDVASDACLEVGLKETQITIALNSDGVYCKESGHPNYCNTAGTDCYCPINVDKTAAGASYEVKADYALGTKTYSVVVADAVEVLPGITESFTTQFCKNAVQNWDDPAAPTLVFSNDYEVIDGKYVVAEGTSLSLAKILAANPTCSNQGPGPVQDQVEIDVNNDVPVEPTPQFSSGIRLFVFVENQDTGEYLCSKNTGDGDFKEDITHDDLVNSDQGIIFEFDDTDRDDFFVGSKEFNDFAVIRDPGQYKLYIDHLNNVCRSPLTYVCPNTGDMYDPSLPEGCNNKGVEPYKEVDIVVNGPPELNDVPNQELVSGFQPYWTVDLCEYVADGDNTCGTGADSDVEFTITSQSNSDLINCNVLSHFFYCDEPGDAIGTSIIELEVYDQIERSVTALTVNVREKIAQDYNILLKWGQTPDPDLADLT